MASTILASIQCGTSKILLTTTGMKVGSKGKVIKFSDPAFSLTPEQAVEMMNAVEDQTVIRELFRKNGLAVLADAGLAPVKPEPIMPPIHGNVTPEQVLAAFDQVDKGTARKLRKKLRANGHSFLAGIVKGRAIPKPISKQLAAA